jgi:hypothetical protein
MNSWYNKFYIALLGALVSGGPLVADGHLSWSDMIAIAIGLLTAMGVRQVANGPKYPPDTTIIRP